MRNVALRRVVLAAGIACTFCLMLGVAVGASAAYAGTPERDGVLSSGPQEEPSLAPLQPPAPGDDWDIWYTISWSVPVFGLTGDPVGEATHTGRVKCRTNCSGSIELIFDSGAEYRYRFRTPLSLDPEARRAVVSGVGRITGNGVPERFSFAATFEDNGDGTLTARYDASRPDASFIVPDVPGLMVIQ